MIQRITDIFTKIVVLTIYPGGIARINSSELLLYNGFRNTGVKTFNNNGIIS